MDGHNYDLAMSLCKKSAFVRWVSRLSVKAFHNGGFLARYPRYFAYVTLY
jgi:hypothetical protein